MKKLFAVLLVICICTCVSVFAGGQAPPGEKQTYLLALNDNSLVNSNETIAIENPLLLEYRAVGLTVYNYIDKPVAINLALSSLGPVDNKKVKIWEPNVLSFSNSIQQVARSGALSFQHSYWLTAYNLKLKPLLL